MYFVFNYLSRGVSEERKDEKRETEWKTTYSFGKRDSMRLLTERIAKSLVDQPEMVEVNEITGTSTIILELKVAKSDIGKIIGKEGKTAIAMRTCLNAAGRKINKRVILEIVE